MSFQNKRKKIKSKNNKDTFTTNQIIIKTLNNTFTSAFDDIIQSIYGNKYKDFSSFKLETITNQISQYQSDILNFEKEFELLNIKKGKINEILFSNSKIIKFGNENTLVHLTENGNTAKNLSRTKNTLIRGTTCFYKNSFCFEIIPINDSSVNLSIGFSKIDANFFESNNYLGQTNKNESFGYDLNRKIACCNKNILNYGTYIHEGDIIGVIIDFINSRVEYYLNIDFINSRVEYYLNGKSLGACFTQIPNGENIAFFPSVTLSENCGVIFNFGGNRKLEFLNSYKNSFCCDDVLSIETNVFNITLNFIDFLNQILKIKNNLQIFTIDLMLSDVFIFLGNISFDDEFLIREVLFQFLINDFSSSIDIFLIFIKYSDDKIKFINKIISILCQEINYISYGKDFSHWKNLIELFYNLISNQQILEL